MILRRTSLNPSLDNLLSRSALGLRQIESQQHVSMIIHNGNATNINGEDSDQFFESLFNPQFAMRILFSAQEGPPDTP